jgi:hypothetical protein
LIRSWDIVISRKWETFKILMDNKGDAFLVDPNNIPENLTKLTGEWLRFTTAMLENYKVVVRNLNTWEKTGWYRTTKKLDKLQNRRIPTLIVKYPRRFFKVIKNTIAEINSFSEPSDNPQYRKIDKYNFIFREETLGNNPQNILKPGSLIKKWILSTFDVSPNVSFSKFNWKTCPSIKNTGIENWDIIVNKKWEEFIAIKEWSKIYLRCLDKSKLGKKSDLADFKRDDLKVVKREGKRDFTYIANRIVDLGINNIPLSNITVWWLKRRPINPIRRSLWKNKLEINQQKDNFLSKLDQIQSFDNLYSEIDKVKKIKCEPIWETYSPKQLKNIIEKVRIGDLDIMKIPEELWLRDKVEELAKKEKDKKNSNKKITV